MLVAGWAWLRPDAGVECSRIPWVGGDAQQGLGDGQRDELTAHAHHRDAADLAAYLIAVQLVDEGVITTDEALDRVSGGRLARLMFPRFGTLDGRPPLARGIPASPGAAVGAVVFDSAEAVRRDAAGQHVVLVRQETTPGDLPGMVAAQAILTSHGGKTIHAAVVARGMGKVCVCGAEELDVDITARHFTAWGSPRTESGGGTVIPEGTIISVDGSAGTAYAGALSLVDSPVMRYWWRSPWPRGGPPTRA